MNEKILSIIEEVTGVSPNEFGPNEDLFEEGLLDSFGTIQMFVRISEECGVQLDIADTAREEVNTVEKIIRLINRMSD